MLRKIAITWHIEDVQSIRSDLTDQASNILSHLKNNHDATVEINWDTIDVADMEYKGVSA
jgi:hypothetical protein